MLPVPADPILGPAIVHGRRRVTWTRSCATPRRLRRSGQIVCHAAAAAKPTETVAVLVLLLASSDQNPHQVLQFSFHHLRRTPNKSDWKIGSSSSSSSVRWRLSVGGNGMIK